MIFIYYPYSLIYLLPSPLVTKDTSFSISIPKIKAQAPVIENVNPWLPLDYQKALEKGVAEAQGSTLPGQNGTIFLFAHSSQPPWKITRYNTSFLRLGELKTGDTIKISYKGQEYKYLVRSKKEVWPSEVDFLKDLNKSGLQNNPQTLILQTCIPIGTSLKRLLVFATLMR